MSNDYGSVSQSIAKTIRNAFSISIFSTNYYQVSQKNCKFALTSNGGLNIIQWFMENNEQNIVYSVQTCHAIDEHTIVFDDTTLYDSYEKAFESCKETIEEDYE